MERTLRRKARNCVRGRSCAVPPGLGHFPFYPGLTSGAKLFRPLRGLGGSLGGFRRIPEGSFRLRSGQSSLDFARDFGARLRRRASASTSTPQSDRFADRSAALRMTGWEEVLW